MQLDLSMNAKADKAISRAAALRVDISATRFELQLHRVCPADPQMLLARALRQSLWGEPLLSNLLSCKAEFIEREVWSAALGGC